MRVIGAGLPRTGPKGVPSPHVNQGDQTLRARLSDKFLKGR